MMRIRSVYAPLDDPNGEPRWYVVRNMHRAVIESRVLPPGADLKRIFIASMLEYIDAGWKLGEFRSITAHFFYTKGGDRRMVEITPTKS